MAYKDKALQRESTKERVRRHRALQQGVTKQGVIPEGVTYPAVVLALTDIKKRAKLQAICEQLKRHNVLSEVRYGVEGPTFDVIGEMLDCIT